MGQLEKYGLYVLCLVIFLILGVTLWGGGDAAPQSRKQEAQTPIRAPNPAAPSGAPTPPTSPSPTVEPKAVDISGLLQPEPRSNEPKKSQVAEAPKAGEKPNEPNGTGSAPSNPTGSSPVAEAKSTTYKVQSGDTFESIARSKLGDPKRQTEIAKLNPTVKPNRMRVGQDLVLPGAKPAGKAVEPAIEASGSKSATAKDATAKAADKADKKAADPKGAEPKAVDPKTADAKESSKDAGAERSYVVGKGDTFGRIAQVQLGSGKRVDEIRELNPNVDPTRLRVGQRIKLPKK